MTATLDRPAAPDTEQAPWRERLLPLVNGSGGWVLTMAVTLLAGLLRFIRLDQPATRLTSDGRFTIGYIFDEQYYACDARSLLKHGVEHASTTTDAAFCTLSSDAPAFVVHPPLGKWLIALGEQMFGFNTFGWRFSAAVFGTLTVLLVVRIGRRMTGSTLLGAFAGALLALDGLHFVQSRVATLDVFLCFFVVAAFAALLVDRDRVRERIATATEAELATGVRLGRRPWRWVAGVTFGLAFATKWSALYPVVVMIALTLFWEASARRSAGIRAPWRVTLRRTTAPLLAALLLLPVVVYLGTWTGWFATDGGWDRHWADGRSTSWPVFPDALRSLWHFHAQMLTFHDGLTARHGYQSHPLSWPFLGRPVSYYYPPNIKVGTYGCQTQSGCSREVLAIGTPAIWWLMLPVLLGLLARWVAKRDWSAVALASLMAVSVLAWIPSDQQDRTMFLFYALPSVPFLCLGIALLAGWLIGPPGSTRRLWGSGGVGVYASLVVINFWWLYPVLAAVTLPYDDWRARMWFSSWI